MSVLKKYLPHAMTVFVICCMAAAAEIFDESEIIFPEIAAIATGAMVAPKLSWRTNKVRIFVLIMLCAVLGMLIVAFMPGPVWLQMAIAYAIGLTILTFSGTSFAPMLSAIVLPVLLQTRSVVYLISAAVFTFLILLLRLLLERLGIREEIAYTPAPVPKDRQYWLRFFGKIVVAGLLIFAAVPNGFRFMAAPPLLVAFTEISNPGARPRKFPVRSVLLLALCAVAGAYCRMLITVQLQLPLALAALCAGVIALLMIEVFQLYIPPAAAMMLLAMLIPEEALTLFPVQIAAGSAVLMAAALLFFPEKH